MDTFLALLTAHLLGDFVLQTDGMVARKRHPGILLLHAGIVTLLSAVFLGSLHHWVLLSVFLLHLGIDALKSYLMPDTLRPFVLDQGLHLTVLAALAIGFPMTLADGWWPRLLEPAQLPRYLQALTVASGGILALHVGGILIGKATAPLAQQMQDSGCAGLINGGRTIGYLERFLVFLLFLVDQPGGIGFLIATKSILRFGEIKDAQQRMTAEYIIIGTFMSFAWALLIAVLTQRILALWGGS